VQHLIAADWQEFAKRFPEARVWLRGRGLWREREALEHEAKWSHEPPWHVRKRAEWVQQRLADLRPLDLSADEPKETT